MIDIEEESALILVKEDGAANMVDIPASTDNSVQTIGFDGTPADCAVVVLPGSGTVDRITFCPVD